jgi:hypothetical protein
MEKILIMGGDGLDITVLEKLGELANSIRKEVFMPHEMVYDLLTDNGFEAGVSRQYKEVVIFDVVL